MIKSKKQMYMVIGIFALVLFLGGTTYAFFNYTRTGVANNIRTGRIYFNTAQSNTLNLTNVFPMSSTDASNANLDAVSIRIQGDTTYANGEEFEISIVDVNNTIGSGQSAKTVPINYIASYSATPVQSGDPNVIGTNSDSYFTARGQSSAVYQLKTTGEATNGEQVLIGFIPSGSTGIDGTLTIKAYLDSSKVAISDTYPAEETDTNSDGYIDGTPTSFGEGKTVLTTTEWNALQNTQTPLSFKIKAVSQEETWVENPNTLYNKVKAMSRGTMNSGTDFGTVASSDTTNHPYGVYQLVENGLANPIYFYRGDHTVKNNVIFDNKCWLIVRTTETNSTRMIYNGTPVDGHCTITEGNNTMISLYQSDSVNSDGNYDYSTTEQSGYTLKSGTAFPYNVNYNDVKYEGYTYDNGVSSNMKNALEAWYEGAISSEGKAKVETSTYCNDTRVDESVTFMTQFMPATRASSNTPSVLCPTGANAISSKIGFLTVDEKILSGRTFDTGMQDYLYNNSYWWLGSPYSFDGGAASMFIVGSDSGNYSGGDTYEDDGLRPVVSILSNTAITGGDGSQLTPWIIG